MTADSHLPRRVGYCTNVHAGATLAEAKRQLATHAAEVQRLAAPHGRLNIGLWLSAGAARELPDARSIADFRAWLEERRLRVFTINGFPHGNFHEPIVKHRVYEPSWADRERLRYTLDLARILAGLMDEGDEAGISTLPVGWPGPPCAPVDREAAARQLREAARALDRIGGETGRTIHLDLEPEPGCILSTSGDVIAFHAGTLLRNASAHEQALMSRHLRACHDVCHAAVMFEDQREVFASYDAAGIAIGKIQVSSAIALDLLQPSDVDRARAIGALRPFANDRYLHQTTRRTGADLSFFEDLAPALDVLAQGDSGEEAWRVHYHVPITAPNLGVLGSTQSEIARCLDLLAARSDARDLEVETYTWTALPTEHRPRSLAEGIAHEVQWLHAALGERDLRVEAD